MTDEIFASSMRDATSRRLMPGSTRSLWVEISSTIVVARFLFISGF